MIFNYLFYPSNALNVEVGEMTQRFSLSSDRLVFRGAAVTACACRPSTRRSNMRLQHFDCVNGPKFNSALDTITQHFHLEPRSKTGLMRFDDDKQLCSYQRWDWSKTVVVQNQNRGLKEAKTCGFLGSERHPLVDTAQHVFVLCDHNLKQRSCPDLMFLHDRTSQVDYKSPRRCFYKNKPLWGEEPCVISSHIKHNSKSAAAAWINDFLFSFILNPGHFIHLSQLVSAKWTQKFPALKIFEIQCPLLVQGNICNSEATLLLHIYTVYIYRTRVESCER